MRMAILFSLLCCAAHGGLPACSAPPAATLLDVELCWADYYARAYGVPLEFVQAVIDVESAWHGRQRNCGFRFQESKTIP